jgi:hypothetical protein
MIDFNEKILFPKGIRRLILVENSCIIVARQKVKRI